MNTQRLGQSDLVVSRLAFGNMRCVGTWNPAEATTERRAAGVRSHVAAFEAGYTLFDTADIYCDGVCEEVLGQFMREVPEARRRIVVASKCGIRFAGKPNPDSPHRFDFSHEHIVRSCNESLRRMGIETIDLYQLHRPDYLMNPEEVAGAFAELHRSGKVRFFGVSNFLPAQVSALQAFLPMPLLVNQVEIHLGRIACLEDGTLWQCLERRMTPLSWSPLAGGWLGQGRKLALNDPQYAHRKNIQNVADDVARELGVSRTVVALAWLMKHPSGIIPIVGSNNPEHIRDAARADTVEMSREQWYRLVVAARGTSLP